MFEDQLFEKEFDSSPDNPIVAVLRIEANVKRGEIVLPDFGPTLLSSGLQGGSILLPEGVALYDKMLLRVGRAPNNDLILDIANVSRFHAVFTASTSGVVLSDLGSKNGTFVNDRRLTTPMALQTGDVIDIGPARIVVKLKLASLQDPETQLQATEVDQMTSAGIVTVFVADIRNYTHLSEMLPPSAIAEMLNTWFDSSSEIILKYGGEVDKYIGDCVMALWRGTDMDARKFTSEAVQAALEVKKETDKLSKSPIWKYRDRHPWSCRVSLSTGSALVGTVGGAAVRDYTVLGDVVNVAFRLDGIASKLGYDLLMSDSTAEYVKDAFKLKNLGMVDVKGRSRKVHVFTLLVP